MMKMMNGKKQESEKMKIIIWHKTNYLSEDEIKVYSLEGKSEKESRYLLKELWQKEIEKTNYDIDEHIEETYFDETNAKIKNYDGCIDMWIEETNKI